MINFRKSALASAVIAVSLGLTGCGGSDSKKDPVTPVNQAPTDIQISASSITEDTLGVAIGALTASDDATSGLTFTVSDARFEIVDGELKVKDRLAFNFEEAAEVAVDITVTDAGGLTFTKTITLTVSDIEAENGVNVYEFESNFDTESSVSYTGQTARHALSAEIKDVMSQYKRDFIDAKLNTMTPQEISTEARAQLDALWSDYDAISANDIKHLGSLDGYQQKTFYDISKSGKELSGKIAGADGDKMYKQWLAAGAFQGWSDFGNQAATPEGLVKHFFDLFEAQVFAIANQDLVANPLGEEINFAYVTPEGLDLVQLVQKHTLGAVMFSQATDDYLGRDATTNDGLTSDNKEAYKGSANYTALEHQFDEGFGYFGAARDYLEYSDAEIAKKGGRENYQGKHDTDDTDGKEGIDLAAEYVWGNASNAAKRDYQTYEDAEAKDKFVQTDFTAQAMTHFIAGRQLITDKYSFDLNEFTNEEQETLYSHVFQAVNAWEKAIAATVVHYINEVGDDIANIEDGEYTSSEFANYAKHWGEMKGFALNFQFSPYSPFAQSDEVHNPKIAEFGEAKFVELHTLLGDKPVLGSEEDFDAYKLKLKAARDMLAEAYDFADANSENW